MMSEKVLVAHRVVEDGLASSLGEDYSHKVHELPISEELLSSCKSASMRHRLYMEEQEKTKKMSESSKRKLDLRQQIASCEEKKKKIEKSVRRHTPCKKS